MPQRPNLLRLYGDISRLFTMQTIRTKLSTIRTKLSLLLSMIIPPQTNSAWYQKHRKKNLTCLTRHKYALFQELLVSVDHLFVFSLPDKDLKRVVDTGQGSITSCCGRLESFGEVGH